MSNQFFGETHRNKNIFSCFVRCDCLTSLFFHFYARSCSVYVCAWLCDIVSFVHSRTHTRFLCVIVCFVSLNSRSSITSVSVFVIALWALHSTVYTLHYSIFESTTYYMDARRIITKLPTNYFALAAPYVWHHYENSTQHTTRTLAHSSVRFYPFSVYMNYIFKIKWNFIFLCVSTKWKSMHSTELYFVALCVPIILLCVGPSQYIRWQ